MESTLILLAIPLLLGATAVEQWVEHVRGRATARMPDTLNDLFSAAGHLALGPALKFGPFLGYAWVERRYGLLPLDGGPATWVFGFLLVDVVYYWRHRMSHRLAGLWAFHQVHHQSHDFNLAVAQRLGWFQDFVMWPTLVPLALLGLPVEVAVTSFFVNHAYQFVLHVKSVRSFGPLGLLLLSPGDHQVHHAANARYLDKNFGGVLNVWDRLFGSYEPLVEEPVFGTTQSLSSWSPVHNNVGPLVALVRKMRTAGSPIEAVRTLVRPPAWDPRTGRLVAPPPPPGRASAPTVRCRWTQAWILVQVLACIAGAALLVGGDLGTGTRLALGAWVLGSLVVQGAMLEGRPRARLVEAVRVAGSAAVVATWVVA